MSGKTVCAVIGAGRLGFLHASNVRSNIPNAELKYIVTSREESAKEAAKKLNIEHWTTDIKTVLEDEEVDAVIIVTPTETHGEYIKKCVEYGKHIFVDKPITETVTEAKEVVELIQKNDIICQVGFMRRFDPAYVQAKERILAGDIGEPIYIKGVSRDPGSPPENFIKQSGGIFIDLCIHEYDIARYLIDDEVESIQTFGSVKVHEFMHKYNDVDQSLSYLTFKNGVTAEIEGSRNSTYGYDVRGEVMGTEGMIQIGAMQDYNNTIFMNGKTYNDNIPDFQTTFQVSFLKELEHFIDCVQQGVTPSVNEVDGLLSLQVAEAAKKSFEEQKKIYL